MLKILSGSDVKVAIWGFGKEGRSLYGFLRKRGVKNISILIDEPLKVSEDLGIPVVVGNKALCEMKSGSFDLVLKSPGISLYRSEIKQAQRNGTQFSSATNLWFENNPKTKKIVITGTKGKSTTASLLYHVLKEAGLSVLLAGNVGVPLLNLKSEADYTVIELSSYQLADLKYSPDIFVILNLFPEHLQWHLTHENYYNDKLRPLEFEDDFKVLANDKSEILKEVISRTNKNIEWFNANKALEKNTRLKGKHNQENIDAVLKVSNTLGLDELNALQSIQTFIPLMHRMQEFISAKGFLCVNDSISTTPESTIAALKVYQNKNKILILGGTDRGQNYNELINHLKCNFIKAILLLPKNGKQIMDHFRIENINTFIKACDNLEEAVGLAKLKASSEDIVILSPAAPSYDQFANFEERGELFINLMTE